MTAPTVGGLSNVVEGSGRSTKAGSCSLVCVLSSHGLCRLLMHVFRALDYVS
jgi:hypothetical protein